MKKYNRSSSIPRAVQPRLQRNSSGKADVSFSRDSSCLSNKSRTRFEEESLSGNAKFQQHAIKKHEHKSKTHPRHPIKKHEQGSKTHPVFTKNQSVRKRLSNSLQKDRTNAHDGVLCSKKKTVPKSDGKGTKCRIQPISSSTSLTKGIQRGTELAVEGRYKLGKEEPNIIDKAKLIDASERSGISSFQNIVNFDGSRLNPIEEASLILNSDDSTAMPKDQAVLCDHLEESVSSDYSSRKCDRFINEKQDFQVDSFLASESISGQHKPSGDMDRLSGTLSLNSCESLSDTITFEESSSDCKVPTHKPLCSPYQNDRYLFDSGMLFSVEYGDSDSVASSLSTIGFEDASVTFSCEHKPTSLSNPEPRHNRMSSDGLLDDHVSVESNNQSSISTLEPADNHKELPVSWTASNLCWKVNNESIDVKHEHSRDSDFATSMPYSSETASGISTSQTNIGSPSNVFIFPNQDITVQFDSDIFPLFNTSFDRLEDISDDEPLFWPLTPNSYSKEDKTLDNLELATEYLFGNEEHGTKDVFRMSTKSFVTRVEQGRTLPSCPTKQVALHSSLSESSASHADPSKHEFLRSKISSPKNNLKSKPKATVHSSANGCFPMNDTKKKTSVSSGQLVLSETIEKSNGSARVRHSIQKGSMTHLDSSTKSNNVGTPKQLVVSGTTQRAPSSTMCDHSIEKHFVSCLDSLKSDNNVISSVKKKHIVSLDAVENNIHVNQVKSTSLSSSDSYFKIRPSKSMKQSVNMNGISCIDDSINYESNDTITVKNTISVEGGTNGHLVEETVNISTDQTFNNGFHLASQDSIDGSIEMFVGLNEFDGHEEFTILEDEKSNSVDESNNGYVHCALQHFERMLYSQNMKRQKESTIVVTLDSSSLGCSESSDVSSMMCTTPTKPTMENRIVSEVDQVSCKELADMHQIGHFDSPVGWLAWLQIVIQAFNFLERLYQKRKFLSHEYDTDNVCCKSVSDGNCKSHIKEHCKTINQGVLESEFHESGTINKLIHLKNNDCSCSSISNNYGVTLHCLSLLEEHTMCNENHATITAPGRDYRARESNPPHFTSLPLLIYNSHHSKDCTLGTKETKNDHSLQRPWWITEVGLMTSNAYRVNQENLMSGSPYFDVGSDPSDFNAIQVIETRQFFNYSEGMKEFEGMIIYFCVNLDAFIQVLHCKGSQSCNHFDLKGYHAALKSSEHCLRSMECEDNILLHNQGVGNKENSLWRRKGQCGKEARECYVESIDTDKMQSHTREFTVDSPSMQDGENCCDSMEQRFKALESELVEVKKQNKKLEKLLKSMVTTAKRLEHGMRKRRRCWNRRLLLRKLLATDKRIDKRKMEHPLVSHSMFTENKHENFE